MTDYISSLQAPGAYHHQAVRLAEQLRTEATITRGVIRWDSNGAVPPAECIALAVHLGLPVDASACEQARNAENSAFIAEYRRISRAPSKAQRAEMRSQYGRGKTVVNVISGRKTRV